MTVISMDIYARATLSDAVWAFTFTSPVAAPFTTR